MSLSSKKRSGPPLGINMTPSKTPLGKFLRKRRLALGKTQAEVAGLIGIKQVSYSNLEIGQYKHSNLKRITRLAKALKCDRDELSKLVALKPDPAPITELGKFIQERRKKLGITRVEMAKKLGNVSTYRLELSGTKIHLANARKLAKVLKCKVSLLMPYVGARPQKSSDSKLGQLIRTQRKEQELSSAELAYKLKVTRSYLGLLELGRFIPSRSSKILERLAKILKLDLSELVALVPMPKRRVRKPSYTPLGTFLTRRSLELGFLTAQDASQAAGISLAAYWQLERGFVSNPTQKVIKKLAAAMQCKIIQLQALVFAHQVQLAIHDETTEVMLRP